MPKAARKSTGKSKPSTLAKSPLSLVQNASSDDETTQQPPGSAAKSITSIQNASSTEKPKGKTLIKKASLSHVMNASEAGASEHDSGVERSPSNRSSGMSDQGSTAESPMQLMPQMEFYEHGEAMDLEPYLEANPPTMYQMPSELLYATSFLVATIQPHQSIHMRSMAPVDDHITQFREELFNVADVLSQTEESKKAIFRPSFYSNLGDYIYATAKDRDTALRHGFLDEKDMFDWLNRLLGCGHYLDKEKFETPWHDIEMKFIPRHRNSHEDDSKGAKGKAKAKAKLEEAEDDADTEMSLADIIAGRPSVTTAPPPAPGVNGTDPPKGKKKRKSMPAPPAPPPPDGEEPELPYTINLDHLINAVVRHPLLFPAHPVTAEFIVRNSPHQLTDNSLLYVLSHGKMENEYLSDQMRELGMYVAANVITHRKKKALKLLPFGGKNYEQRKRQFDLYRRSIERSNPKAQASSSNSGGKGFWSTVLDL